ncbi:putative CAD trifunctional protein [Phakopsora pachyrhizi]|nr:putative CAD trifunctional protein [Phakopsora pachyrhizi]
MQHISARFESSIYQQPQVLAMRVAKLSKNQAIKGLKQEGVYTILINPNIATIQTTKGLDDKVYFFPITPEFVRKVIQYKRPNGISCTFGGQTALLLGVQVLGTPISTIVMTEDQELFANSMAKIGKKCVMSASATSANNSIDAANKSGYPVILQAAYALGGLGSGFANNEEELVDLFGKAFSISSQVLIEQSMKGWKEVEYEVVCDCCNICITICNMENFDPLGIHTRDFIVVAPLQTLSDEDNHMLQTMAIILVCHLGVVGEFNIKSSALASKETCYPLAFIAAKLGLGILTSACFEHSLDYCVVKMPRWDLKKFQQVSSKLGSSMKSVGEVMAIGRNFEEAIQKAIRSADPSFTGFDKNHIVTDKELKNELMNPADCCIFAIANAFDTNRTLDEWFLHNLENLVSLEKIMRRYTASHFPVDLLPYAKQLGFFNNQIEKFLNSNELAIWRIRLEFGIRPFVKQIDTVAAEFLAFTNYLFNTYNIVKHHVTFKDWGIIVLGSGVYRIGSSAEFDWCAVRAICTLRGHGPRAVMINYIPETFSTNFDKANCLYFKNISVKTILDIYDAKKSSGVMISKAKENTISCSFWKG